MAGIVITNSTIKLPFSSLFKGTHFSGFRSSIAHLYLLAFHRNTKIQRVLTSVYMAAYCLSNEQKATD